MHPRSKGRCVKRRRQRVRRRRPRRGTALPLHATAASGRAPYPSPHLTAALWLTLFTNFRLHLTHFLVGCVGFGFGALTVTKTVTAWNGSGCNLKSGDQRMTLAAGDGGRTTRGIASRPSATAPPAKPDPIAGALRAAASGATPPTNPPPRAAPRATPASRSRKTPCSRTPTTRWGLTLLHLQPKHFFVA